MENQNFTPINLLNWMKRANSWRDTIHQNSHIWTPTFRNRKHQTQTGSLVICGRNYINFVQSLP